MFALWFYTPCMVVLVIGFGNCIRWGKVDELNLDNFEGFLKPQDMGQLGRWKGLIGFLNVSVFWLSWWENRLPSKINRVTSWGVGAESMRNWRGIGEFGICPDSCSEAKIWWVPRSSRHRRRTFLCLGQSLHWIIPTCVDSMLHMWHTFLHDWAICWSKCWWIFQQHAAILQYYIYNMYPLPGCIESLYPHKPVGYKRPQICWLNAPI